MKQQDLSPFIGKRLAMNLEGDTNIITLFCTLKELHIDEAIVHVSYCVGIKDLAVGVYGIQYDVIQSFEEILVKDRSKPTLSAQQFWDAVGKE